MRPLVRRNKPKGKSVKLNSTYQDVTVNNIKVKRVGSEFELTISFHDQSEHVNVILCGVRDIDSVCELFEAERLWLSDNETCQTEFGKFTLGISHESFTEIYFDSLG